MTIKPFAIQGADLTLGGVNLQAGATTIVIPGVTQATNYFVEEVDEQDGNNPSIFGSNAGAVTVIDNAEYLYLVDDGDTPSADYVAATYSVDELDDGQIESINVESDGVFLSADKTRVEAGNMWATTTPTPFVSFNSANWTQIPYRPKIRAGAVENVGGGGNANTGNFTFNADTIANNNDASIEVGGGSPIANVEVNAVDELVPPGGVWRLFIDDSEYPTLGATVQIGGTVTTSWGTPITATITDIQQDTGDWQIHVDQDITVGHNDYDLVTFTPASSKTWTFGTDGDLTAPGDITTGLDGLGGRFIQDCADGTTSMRWINANQGSSNTQLIRAYTGDPKLNTEVERAQIKLNWDQTEDKSGLTIRTFDQSNPNNEVDHDWLFKGDGVLQLPVGGDIVDSNGDSVLSGGTSIQSTTWVQDFETSLGATDVPLMATSVEYLANGDIVALFTHDVNSNSSTYSGVARFDSYGTRVWSMKFEGNDGDIYANGWGLAVDNNNGFIYVAGAKATETGYEVATLTKLSEIDGGVVWSKQYDVGYDNSNSVVDVASDGSPVVVGYADNGTDRQVVTTKINADTGSVTWSRALDGQGDEEAYGMAVGPSGEVVSVGYMTEFGTNSYVASAYTTPASNVNWTTPFVNVLTNGVNFDVNITGGVPTITINSDSQGGRTVDEIIGTISGSIVGGTDGIDDMIVNVATATTDQDDRILVVKYLSDGTIDWQAAVQVETGYDCKGADADIDGSGNIYVCGSFEYDNSGNTYQAIIMFKFDSAGVKQWSRKVQGDCEDFAASIVVGPDNYLYLSAVTGTTNTSDYTMVIAKYNTNGTVVWQRLLDNTTTWTFGGGLFFNNNGGSNLAVKDGYVAVSGSFGDPGTTPHAVVAQFDTLGTTFSMGDYDFIAASFSGVLDTAASDITVTGASKLDSDYIEEFTTSNFSPTVDLTSDLIGTRYSSTNGTVGTVKLISPGNRKIEEVYGYNSVSVTSRNFGSTVTSTAALANTGNTQSIPISVSALELADLVALVNGTAGYYFEVSLDQSNWRKASYSGYDNTLGSEYFAFYLTNSFLPVSQGQTAYYRIVTGADPVVWWDAADLPNGDNNFRGATIDYHAYTGESTIIGTIHIVNDSGEEHITHSEVQSGSTDGDNDDLWVVLNEGTVSYQRIDGESQTLKIQWTAKVFYGSEFYD